jgi:hypothetical protein
MDQLEKCMQSLRVLIASGDDDGIILAEEAVNEYLAAFPVKQHAGALHLLQDALTPLWRARRAPKRNLSIWCLTT